MYLSFIAYLFQKIQVKEKQRSSILKNTAIGTNHKNIPNLKRLENRSIIIWPQTLFIEINNYKRYLTTDQANVFNGKNTLDEGDDNFFSESHYKNEAR
jgi:hypothetical protein